MPLFEFDDGRLIPAQFGRTVRDGLTDDILKSVREQVLEIADPLPDYVARFRACWFRHGRGSAPPNGTGRIRPGGVG